MQRCRFGSDTPTATERWINTAKPDAVILTAGKVGGIAFNNAYPVDSLFDNLSTT
jgi:hypothetical protein